MKKLEHYPEVLDVIHIQEYLGIGKRQAYKLVKSGVFHVTQVGKRIKISKAVFQQWLEGADNKNI